MIIHIKKGIIALLAIVVLAIPLLGNFSTAPLIANATEAVQVLEADDTADETALAEDDAEEVEEESTKHEWTKGQKVAAYLAVFTVFFIGTAIITMRPSFKKLKEQQKK